MAVWKWQRPAYRLLLLWLSVLLVPAMLSTDPGGLVPNTLRMIGAVPASLSAYWCWHVGSVSILEWTPPRHAAARRVHSSGKWNCGCPLL